MYYDVISKYNLPLGAGLQQTVRRNHMQHWQRDFVCLYIHSAFIKL